MDVEGLEEPRPSFNNDKLEEPTPLGNADELEEPTPLREDERVRLSKDDDELEEPRPLVVPKGCHGLSYYAFLGLPETHECCREVDTKFGMWAICSLCSIKVPSRDRGKTTIIKLPDGEEREVPVGFTLERFNKHLNSVSHKKNDRLQKEAASLLELKKSGKKLTAKQKKAAKVQKRKQSSIFAFGKKLAKVDETIGHAAATATANQAGVEESIVDLTEPRSLALKPR